MLHLGSVPNVAPKGVWCQSSNLLPSQGDVLTEVTGRLVKADLVSCQGNPLIRLGGEVAAELRRDQRCKIKSQKQKIRCIYSLWLPSPLPSLSFTDRVNLDSFSSLFVCSPLLFLTSLMKMLLLPLFISPLSQIYLLSW